jgi:Na+/glutamate symporter
MKKNGYLAIGIATGMFTATLVGLSVASYLKSKRKLSRRINSLDNTTTSLPRSAEQVEDMTV